MTDQRQVQAAMDGDWMRKQSLQMRILRMFFDYQSATLEPFMAYPDCAFASVPRENPIIEQEIIQGGSSTTVSITGRIEN